MQKTEKNLDDVLTGLLVYCVLSFLGHLFFLAADSFLGDNVFKNANIYRTSGDPLNRFYFDNLITISSARAVFSAFFMTITMFAIKRSSIAFNLLQWILVVAIFIHLGSLGWVVYDYFFIEHAKNYFETLKFVPFIGGWVYLSLIWSLILIVVLMWVKFYLGNKVFSKLFK